MTGQIHDTQNQPADDSVFPGIETSNKKVCDKREERNVIDDHLMDRLRGDISAEAIRDARKDSGPIVDLENLFREPIHSETRNRKVQKNKPLHHDRREIIAGDEERLKHIEWIPERHLHIGDKRHSGEYTRIPLRNNSLRKGTCGERAKWELLFDKIFPEKFAAEEDRGMKNKCETEKNERNMPRLEPAEHGLRNVQLCAALDRWRVARSSACQSSYSRWCSTHLINLENLPKSRFRPLPVMRMKLSNAKQFPKHFRGIGNGADGRALIVIPLDRNFANAVSITPREIKNLHIEGKSIDALLRKKNLCRIARKPFETALRVPNAANDEELNENIIKPSHRFSIPRLVLLDEQAPFGSATADDDIIFAGSHERNNF